MTVREDMKLERSAEGDHKGHPMPKKEFRKNFELFLLDLHCPIQ